MRVMEERSPKRSHLRFWGKLRGMAGSSCPSQPMMPASRSVTGMSSGSRRSFSFLDRVVSFVTTPEILLVVIPCVGTRSRVSSFGGPGLADSPWCISVYIGGNAKGYNSHVTPRCHYPRWIEGSRHPTVASPGPYWKRCPSPSFLDSPQLRLRAWKEDGETASGRRGEWKKRACEERWKRDTGAIGT